MTKVLVIEDDESLRSSIVRYFRGAGYDVSEAGDGRVALKLAREIQPDLVITDIVMPEWDGIETIIVLKSLDPVPRIIAMSGAGGRPGSSFAPLEDAWLLGADSTINKPFTLEALKATAEALLDRVDPEPTTDA